MSADGGPEVGIIGCGRIGQRHLQAYLKSGATVVALADADAGLAAEVASRTGCRSYGDYRELLVQEQLDGVSVCTPTHLHREMVEAAADQRVHILCEKPLATSSADAVEMAAACQKSQVGLSVGFFHRFHEPIQRFKDLIDSGELGETRLFANRFHLDPTGDRRIWVQDRVLAGGGTMMNTAVHSVDLFRYLVGPIKRVSARAQRTTVHLEVEDLAVVLVESRDGALGVIEAFDKAPRSEYALRVQGSEGEGKVGWDPPSLWVRGRGQSAQRPVAIESKDRFSRIERAIAAFVEFIVGRGPLPVPAALGVESLRVVEAAYRSVDEGCWVEID